MHGTVSEFPNAQVLCACVRLRAFVPNSCLHSISTVAVFAGPNLINSVCAGRGLVLSAGGNVMSQWIRLMG